MSFRAFSALGPMSLLAAGHLAAGAGTTPPARSVVRPRAVSALLAPWRGPFGGLPPWDKVDPGAFPAAVKLAMAEQRAEIRAIGRNPAAPTFANTIAALERSGRALDRVRTLFQVHAGSLKTGPMPRIEKALRPRLAGFDDEIIQDPALFRRIEAIYQGRGWDRLTPGQRRLTWLYHTRFVRGGARLAPDGKARVKAINQRLATLYTQFEQNVLADEHGQFTVIEREAGLAGMGPDFRAAAARAAAARGLDGRWVVENTRSAVEPFLSFAEDRALRERVWRTFTDRGDRPGRTCNCEPIVEILRLRQERARLLGYPTHAHWAVELAMAGTPERALELLEGVWKPAVDRVREEVAEMQALADREGAGITIAPWDYRFYMERVRKAAYDLDAQAVKPYLQLDRLREGMFWAAGRLYGLTFTPLEGIPVQHPDVSAWAVKDAAGRPAGLWYFDPYARPGKHSGAWMDNYRRQEAMGRAVLPIVSNNANFIKGAPGEPVLLSWDDAVTLFHEFGHALHGLLSQVRYPSLSGTAVASDFVEFPSQLNEHWLSTPELLGRFATHFRTGEPIPAELAGRIRRTATFNQGFQTLEYLASALVDLKLHLAAGTVADPDAFERRELARLGMPAEIVMRHRPTQFAHVFAGDDYAAGYYSYLWADALTADAWEAFQEEGGPWSPETAARYRRTVLEVGNTVDPLASWRAFRGRDVDPAALMRKRGFLPGRARSGQGRSDGSRAQS
jgi:peptidyl-dipeptidase Dcp